MTFGGGAQTTMRLSEQISALEKQVIDLTGHLQRSNNRVKGLQRQVRDWKRARGRAANAMKDLNDLTEKVLGWFLAESEAPILGGSDWTEAHEALAREAR